MHGFAIEKISEDDEERPDFLVQDEQNAYLVELKTKSESEEYLQERRDALATGRVYGEHIPVTPRNRLSGIIRKAKSQLRNHLGEEDIFRIPWLLCTGHTAEARMDQFESTLYGSASIINLDRSGMRTCYFFHNSDFYRYKDTLAGAIVSTPSTARLLLNPYYGRSSAFANSSVFGIKELNPINPIAEEKSGLAYIADGDIDRNSEEAVLSHLKTKYKANKLMKMTMQHMSGTIMVQDHN
jgi:hypothetical protein